MMGQPNDKLPLISPFISGISLTAGGHGKQCIQQLCHHQPKAGLGQTTLQNQMLIFPIQVWLASWWPSQHGKVIGDRWSRTGHVNIAGSGGTNGPHEPKQGGMSCHRTTATITLTSSYQAQETSASIAWGTVRSYYMFLYKRLYWSNRLRSKKAVVALWNTKYELTHSFKNISYSLFLPLYVKKLSTTSFYKTQEWWELPWGKEGWSQLKWDAAAFAQCPGTQCTPAQTRVQCRENWAALPLGWLFLAASLLGEGSLDLWSSWPLQPTAGLLPMGPCPWHAGYASHAGVALLKPFCSVYRVIYRQEKIDSATQCWSSEL